jgi:hypothetical protein
MLIRSLILHVIFKQFESILDLRLELCKKRFIIIFLIRRVLILILIINLRKSLDHLVGKFFKILKAI